MKIIHHGAVNGVTGSCHELIIDSQNSVLVDCGLFQGTETDSRHSSGPEIDFSLKKVKALVLTHVHIDHCGRIPYLLAAGFKGPIYCSRPSAKLLPLVMADALKVSFTRDQQLINHFIKHLQEFLAPIDYHQPTPIPLSGNSELSLSLSRAGHILGSAYVTCRARVKNTSESILFSGDLGAPYTPLLAAPEKAYGCDTLVLESTYGDRIHPLRRNRCLELEKILTKALEDRGTVLIPAFSIGRTQEILYEMETILYRKIKIGDNSWKELPIILDSPLAAKITAIYKSLQPWWDKEAKARFRQGRHPLSFAQLQIVENHHSHENLVHKLTKSRGPAVVIAASGMCTGGRIVNYLLALLNDPTTDVLFAGYQAQGTPGRDILHYGPQGGYVLLGGQRITIKAAIHSLPGYSAHADQANLLSFVRRMRKRPKKIILVHGDAQAKEILAEKLQENFAIATEIPA
ncbi:MAG: MBL fold metallo-hydrolase [Proteobacteria bacterium]|nr:MBL fold metallo-hydrolase [Pseudomonadota bacterium]